MNPQFSAFAVEASASQVVGSFTAVNESAPPVFEQVYQEQIAADPGSFERTQQRTVENIVHVPISQIQDQFVEGVKDIHSATPGVPSATPVSVIEYVAPAQS